MFYLCKPFQKRIRWTIFIILSKLWIWNLIFLEIQKNPVFRFDQFGWNFQVILTLTKICFNTNKFLDQVSGFPDPESGFFRKNLAKIVKKSGLTVYHDVIHQFSYSNHGKFKAAMLEASSEAASVYIYQQAISYLRIKWASYWCWKCFLPSQKRKILFLLLGNLKVLPFLNLIIFNSSGT